MTAPLNDDSRLAAEALHEWAQRRWGSTFTPQETILAGESCANRLEYGQSAVASTDRLRALEKVAEAVRGLDALLERDQAPEDERRIRAACDALAELDKVRP